MRKQALLSILGLAAMTVIGPSAQAQQWLTSGNVVTNPTDVLGATNAADLSFITDNTERLRITAAGWVTTATGTGLTVDGGTFAVQNAPISLTNGPFFATGSAFTVTTTGTIDLTNNAGSINVQNINGPVDIGTSAGPINLHSNGGPVDIHSNGGSATLATNGGALDMHSVGGPINISTNGDPIDAATNNGPIDFNLGSGIFTINGDVQVNGSGTYTGTWVVASDVRFKSNITQIDNALAKVMNLRGVTYDYRRNEFPKKNFAEGRQMGFIAQEVEKVAPEVVRTGVDGYKGVAYQNLTALLTEAIKQQQTQIEQLQARIARLEAALGRREQLPLPVDNTAQPMNLK